MKNFILFSLVLFSVGSFLRAHDVMPTASEPSSYSNVASSTVKKRYPIGTSDKPVTTQEYCAFLQAKAVYDSYSPWYKKGYYYDHQWMNPGSPDACITRTKASGAYSYTLKSECYGNIIDALESSYAQESFQKWRENPTMSELCLYLNGRIQFLQQGAESQDSGSWDKAQKLLESYPPYKSYAAKDTAFELMNEVAQKAVDSAKVERGRGVYYTIYEASWEKYVISNFTPPLEISIWVAPSKIHTAHFNIVRSNDISSGDYDPALDPDCIRLAPSQLRYDTVPR